jgi:RNase P/RNase MRP subunit p29
MKSTRFTFVVVLAVALCVAGAAVAQTVVKTEVKSGVVIGKTDHSVIIKGEDGTVKEYQVPPGRTAMVDGKEVGLADLKIGTTLTATFSTVEKPVVVKTTTIKDGEVVRVSGSSLVTREKDGFHTYTVPKGFRFNVEGRGEVAVNDLTPGMKLNATIVHTSTKMTTETERGKVAGAAPAAPAPAPVAAAPAPAPAPVAAPAPEPAPMAAAAPAEKPKKLPGTASLIPLLGLLGGLSVAAGAGLRAIRRSR